MEAAASGEIVEAWSASPCTFLWTTWSAHLVWEEAPLFDEHIEAWANGPVVPELHRAHRQRWELKAGETLGGAPARLPKNIRNPRSDVAARVPEERKLHREFTPGAADGKLVILFSRVDIDSEWCLSKITPEDHRGLLDRIRCIERVWPGKKKEHGKLRAETVPRSHVVTLWQPRTMTHGFSPSRDDARQAIAATLEPVRAGRSTKEES